MNKCIKGIALACCCSFIFWACNDFLDEKSDYLLSTPQTLEDLDALLSNSNIIGLEPMLAEISATEYYLEEDIWSALLDEGHKRSYYWAEEGLFQEDIRNDWRAVYDIVYYCNVVLEELEKIERNAKNALDYDRIQGEALFFRGKSMLQAAFIWVEAYDEDLKERKMGLPLRMDSDFNKESKRSTMGETYRTLLQDLQNATDLLPEKNYHPTRPNKAAALGTISRAYMSMRKYEEALIYADKALAYQDELLDFNQLDEEADFPIPEYNEEVIFSSFFAIDEILDHTKMLVSPSLYDLYEENDKRKSVFFSTDSDGKVFFKGRFAVGGYGLFSGISTNELILNKAECYVREQNYNQGRTEVLRLLKTRYDSHFELESDDEELLDIILKERRKELLFRGMRWVDIKRLNKEGYNIVQEREVMGKTFTLSPNDPKYARPFPDFVIAMTGMEQNPQH